MTRRKRKIRGQNTNNAETSSSNNNNISSRLTADASVAWDQPACSSVGAAGPDQHTPDISSIIQEIVARAGWMPGNPLAVIISGSVHRTAESYYGSSSGAPLLHVEYSISGTVP